MHRACAVAHLTISGRWLTYGTVDRACSPYRLIKDTRQNTDTTQDQRGPCYSPKNPPMVGLSLVLATTTATNRAKSPNQPLNIISIYLIPYSFCFYNPHMLKKIKKMCSCFSAHTDLCDFKMVAVH